MNATAPILVPTLDELAVEFERASAIDRAAILAVHAAPSNAALELAVDETFAQVVDICGQISQLPPQTWEHVRLLARALAWVQSPNEDVEPSCSDRLAYGLSRAILDGLPGQSYQPAPPDPDAEILLDYETWRAARNALHHQTTSATDTDDEPFYRAILKAEAAVMRHRPATARGLAVQHVVFTAWGDFEATRSKTFDYQAHVFAMAAVEPDEWTKANPPSHDGGGE